MTDQQNTTHTDDYLDKVKNLIQEHGWAVQGVFPPSPDEGVPFAYTVGLAVKGLPELVMYGLPAQVTQPILNDAATRAASGGEYVAGQMLSELVERFDLAVLDVTMLDDLTVAERLYGPVRAQQLVFPDPQGVYPWQDGYSLSPGAQPLKGVWPNN